MSKTTNLLCVDTNLVISGNNMAKPWSKNYFNQCPCKLEITLLNCWSYL